MSDFQFHHVALSVSDLDRSVAFYLPFGFERVADWEAPDGALRITHLAMRGMVLELFAYREFNGPHPEMAELHRDLTHIGTKHFAFTTTSLDDACQWLESYLGHRPAIIEGRTGIRYLFIQDPDGNWVEIVEETRPFWSRLNP